jgi:hypothetical protein
MPFHRQPAIRTYEFILSVVERVKGQKSSFFKKKYHQENPNQVSEIFIAGFTGLRQII